MGAKFEKIFNDHLINEIVDVNEVVSVRLQLKL